MARHVLSGISIAGLPSDLGGHQREWGASDRLVDVDGHTQAEPASLVRLSSLACLSRPQIWCRIGLYASFSS